MKSDRGFLGVAISLAFLFWVNYCLTLNVMDSMSPNGRHAARPCAAQRLRLVHKGLECIRELTQSGARSRVVYRRLVGGAPRSLQRRAGRLLSINDIHKADDGDCGNRGHDDGGDQDE